MANPSAFKESERGRPCMVEMTCCALLPIPHIYILYHFTNNSRQSFD